MDLALFYATFNYHIARLPNLFEKVAPSHYQIKLGGLFARKLEILFSLFHFNLYILAYLLSRSVLTANDVLVRTEILTTVARLYQEGHPVGKLLESISL